jgi:hypothetical protein
VQDEALDRALEDPELAAEIQLLADVIVAAHQAAEPLDQVAIDHALGLGS